MAVVKTESKSTATAVNDTARRRSTSGQNEKMTNKISNQRYASSARNKRIYFSIAIKRQLQEQSQNQCEYISKLTGKRCESKHFLEIDHKTPLARNGTNAPDNLRRLCRAHNQQEAKENHLI
jgi:5-methylcytosine-specific restriction endonuclease McrA